MADGPARRIVIYAHRPKRAPRKAQAAAIKGPKIVTFKQSGPRLRPELEADPTEQARVRAFLKRMMPNHPLLQDD